MRMGRLMRSVRSQEPGYQPNVEALILRVKGASTWNIIASNLISSKHSPMFSPISKGREVTNGQCRFVDIDLLEEYD